MGFFHKKKNVLPIPDGFAPDSIRVESSICTGETTIGFYSPSEKRLCYAELVKSPAEIQAFYAKYGVSYQCIVRRKGEEKWKCQTIRSF